LQNFHDVKIYIFDDVNLHFPVSLASRYSSNEIKLSLKKEKLSVVSRTMPIFCYDLRGQLDCPRQLSGRDFRMLGIADVGFEEIAVSSIIFWYQ